MDATGGWGRGFTTRRTHLRGPRPLDTSPDVSDDQTLRGQQRICGHGQGWFGQREETRSIGAQGDCRELGESAEAVRTRQDKAASATT